MKYKVTDVWWKYIGIIIKYIIKYDPRRVAANHLYIIFLYLVTLVRISLSIFP